MRLRCPVCHAEAALEAWAEDEAAREMMALLSTLDATLGRPLVAYLGLFRSKTRALAWDRAVRLARDVLALELDEAVLAQALSETVEAMRQKREAGDIRPLENHNYLKRVAESVAARGVARGAAVSVLPVRAPAQSRAMAAISGFLGAADVGVMDG
jgi:Glu-tRNA(Gln) amidotransferase subunit E-like FAD-binding protein